MASKLTLRIDDGLIRQAKQSAKDQGKSVSRMVADYFELLRKPPTEDSLPPVTRSLYGIAAGSEMDEEDYRRYLEAKHQ